MIYFPLIIFIQGYESHPGYQFATHENDVALVRLFREVKFNFYIQPVCLPSEQTRFPTRPTFRCYVTGWGYGSPSAIAHEKILKVRICKPLQSFCRIDPACIRNFCIKFYKKSKLTPLNQITLPFNWKIRSLTFQGTSIQNYLSLTSYLVIKQNLRRSYQTIFEKHLFLFFL